MKEKGLDIMHLERIINVRENIKDTVVKTPLLYSNIFNINFSFKKIIK